MLKKVSVILGVVALSWVIAVSNVSANGYGVDISTNQTAYQTGDTLIEKVHLWNATQEDKIVDIKNWLKYPPNGNLISILNIPNFTLRAGFEIERDIFNHTFRGSEPVGSYSLGARLIHSITGDILSEDIAPFTFGIASPKEWTYMIYMAADNDLEDAGIDDFLEMAQVGSSDKVNIVVQFDRIPGYDTRYGDWKTTKRFLITQGMTPTPANALMDIGEADMGNGQTVKEFVNWTISNYPANKYALIFWNHGSGIIKKLWEERGIRGVCWDNTNGGYLTMDEIETALASKMMNLIGYDACLMGMIEVAYEPKTSSQVMVASEESEPWDGWPYEPIMTALVSNPSMDAALLGSITVKEYIDSYPGESDVTLSAVHTTLSLDDLASKVSAFADVLMANGEWAKIKSARGATEYFASASYVDLYDFAKEIYIRFTDTTVKNAALAVRDAINNNVIAEGHKSGHPDAHGIAIYFPTSGPSPNYYNTNFAINTSWDEFLNEYALH